MQRQYSTRQVAQILGVRPSTLSRAVWDGTVKSPRKSPAGNYMWSVSDIESASWSLKRYDHFVAWQKGEGEDNGA